METSGPSRKRTLRWRSWLGALWLAAFFLGTLDHSVIPTLTKGWRLRFPMPATQYGFVMFAQAPQVVAIPSWIPPGEQEERHLSTLIQTPALGYKQSRIVQNMYATQGAYLSYLCGTNARAGGATIKVRAYDMREPQKAPAVDLFRCNEGRLETP